MMEIQVQPVPIHDASFTEWQDVRLLEGAFPTWPSFSTLSKVANSAQLAIFVPASKTNSYLRYHAKNLRLPSRWHP
jgi:hypothetical protein